MKKKRRMFWHLYPCYLLVILLSLMVITGYTSKTMHAYYLTEVAENLSVRARLLEKQFIEYLISPDTDRVDPLCKAVGKASGTRITVILPNGSVVGDSHQQPGMMENHGNRPEFRAAIMAVRGASERFSQTLKEDMMYVAIPLLQNERLVGALRTSISVSAIDKKLKDIQKKIAVGSIFIALAAAVITLFLSRRISRPVEEMKKGAERFACGDLEHRLAIPDYEEMARLAETMNDMAAHLDNRIKAVTRQRNELGAVLSSMNEAVLAVDKEERIIAYNRAFDELFTHSFSTLSGRSIQEIIRSANLQRFIQETLISGQGNKTDITIYIPGERIIRIDSAPLLGAMGEQIGMLFILNDVTRIKLLENMRRDFAVNVSHEIKTPLTAIKGFVETLLDAPSFDPAETRKFLRIIDKHVNRLVDIVEDLKSLTRIEDANDRKAITFEPSGIGEVISRAVQACQEKADANGIRMEWSCDAALSASINPSLIERALVNLIDNAINYSKSGGTIHISARSTPGDVAIEVNDTGIGIPKKHHERIFERFYRVDKNRSRNSGGTGLGLAIVKHIVLAHGGEIRVDSSPDKGSRFEIRLPRK